ncbi:uncharacterized protein LOC127849327 [Dreissena polymorpha]|nr:uncharacterized protein LOC127849327 [Dreissena polymorpha]
MLQSGKHEIRLKVLNSMDCFGVDVWSMQVSVFTIVNPTSVWCDSGYKLATKKWECMSEEEKSLLAQQDSTSTPTTFSTTTETPTFARLTQHSFRSDCVDRKNIRIAFTTRDLARTELTFRQQGDLQAVVNSSHQSTPRFCDTDIWQIGNIDNDNRELSSIYEGTELHINITNVENPGSKFPIKLLPFVTSDIYIHYVLPHEIEMRQGSAFLTLGLINLTKSVEIGMRYFDHRINEFSNSHVVHFNRIYQVMGWNIPMLGATGGEQHSIHLHFETEANLIMFDFLKMQFNKRDRRLINEIVARKGAWIVRGFRTADTAGTGMRISVNNATATDNYEDVMLLYQRSPFSLYETVAKISSNGMIYPYKMFHVSVGELERLLKDVTGIYVTSNADVSSLPVQAGVQTIDVRTDTGEVVVKYRDESTLTFSLTSTLSFTKLTIISYSAPGNDLNIGRRGPQTLVFCSTNANHRYNAVDTISTGSRDRDILGDIEPLSRQYSYVISKKSGNTLFYANNFIEIDFPN